MEILPLKSIDFIKKYKNTVYLLFFHLKLSDNDYYLTSLFFLIFGFKILMKRLFHWGVRYRILLSIF